MGPRAIEPVPAGVGATRGKAEANMASSRRLRRHHRAGRPAPARSLPAPPAPTQPADQEDSAAARALLWQATVQAQEAERRRVARQLHDELAQSLTGLLMSLDALAPRLARSDADVRKQLERTRAIVATALDQTRRLILDLRPSMLDDMGLVSATRWYAESHLSDRGALVVFQSEGPARRLSSEIETALFRIAQEAIHNVARHAGARQAAVRLLWTAESVTLVVEDDGRGFEPAAVRVDASGTGLGLLGMRERADLVGGHLAVTSQPGAGTRIEVFVPTGAAG
jgi:signal transduction histidine kinase